MLKVRSAYALGVPFKRLLNLCAGIGALWASPVCAGVFEEFAPAPQEEVYMSQALDLSFRPLYYLGALYPFGRLVYTQALTKKHWWGISAGGGLNDRFSFSSALHYQCRLFEENSSTNALGFALEEWWDRSHPKSLEPSVSLSWIRHTQINGHSSFGLALEGSWRWGRGFRSRPEGFFNDVKLMPFALGLELSYRFKWAPVKKLREVQR